MNGFSIISSSITLVVHHCWCSILGTNGAKIEIFLYGSGIIEQPLTWSSINLVSSGMLGSDSHPLSFRFPDARLIDDDPHQGQLGSWAGRRRPCASSSCPCHAESLAASASTFSCRLWQPGIEPELLGGSQGGCWASPSRGALTNLNYPIAAALSMVVIAVLVLKAGDAGGLLRGASRRLCVFKPRQREGDHDDRLRGNLLVCCGVR